METETTLVRAESRVELDSVTSVDGERAVVPLPGDAELDDSLRDLHNVERALVLGVTSEQLDRSAHRPGEKHQNVQERWWP